MTEEIITPPPPPLEERKWYVERRVWIAGVILGTLGLASSSYDSYRKRADKQDAPQFDVYSARSETPNLAVIDPARGVLFRPRNETAKIQEGLQIEFDDTPIGTLQPQTRTGSVFWVFQPQTHDLPEALTADGRHHVRLRFSEGSYSDKIVIWFDTQAPKAKVRVRDDQERGFRVIEGVATDSPSEAPGEISVEVFLHQDSGSIRIPMNVERRSYEDGSEGFEFFARVFGLPEIDSADPQYEEPFFMVYISDQAGNTLFHEMSYAKFVAPGDTTFGQRRSTYVSIQPTSREFGMRTLNFRVLSAALEGEAEETIKLKATLYGLNLRKLEGRPKTPVPQSASVRFEPFVVDGVFASGNVEDAHLWSSSGPKMVSMVPGGLERPTDA